MRRAALLIVAVVMVLFLAILSFTNLLGAYFGKSAEMIGLIVIAVGLLILLLLDRRNKGDEDDHDQDTL